MAPASNRAATCGASCRLSPPRIQGTINTSFPFELLRDQGAMSRQPSGASDLRELPDDHVRQNGDARRPPIVSRLERLDDLVRELSFPDHPDRLVPAFSRF